MKLWRFFRVPENIKDYENIRVQDKFPLYAVTNNKKYAELFQKGRKKKSYICQCTKVNKEDGIKYMNKNRSNVIAYKEVETSDQNYTSIIVKVLMTEGEYDIVNEMLESAAIFKEVGWVPPEIFHKNIISFLDDVDYNNYYKLITGNLINNVDDYDSYPEYNPVFDELGSFIYLYSIDLDLESFPETIKY